MRNHSISPQYKGLPFTKMHGLGNDYVYINAFKQEITDPAQLAREVSERHKGIGSDGVILVAPSERADGAMWMFNADGSEGRMCGNGIRCVGKFLYDKGLVSSKEISVETRSGIKQLSLQVDAENKVSSVSVQMGKAIFAPQLIPATTNGEDAFNLSVPVTSGEYAPAQVFHCVSMGNPHAIMIVDAITDSHVLTLGPSIETANCFPESINVEFVKVLSRNHIEMRVWERGSGETMACGTGACASAVVACKLGLVDRNVCVSLLGGDLEIAISDSWEVSMTGSATIVFEGVLV
jgi:diaminopimelate epimerase